MSQRPVIVIINTQKSLPGKDFTSDMYVHIWEQQESKLRSQGWIPKEEIEGIKYETIDDGQENVSVEVKEAPKDLNTSDTEDVDLELMSLDELRIAYKEKFGKNAHHASKEAGLIKKLKA